MDIKVYKLHYENKVLISIDTVTLFAYLDDHSRLSMHMNKSSWMMGGGRMETLFDQGKGQKVGSHIRLSGKAFGIKIFLDEVVTRREPPLIKIWETVGTPKLLVIGDYRLGFELKPQDKHSLMRVFIDYDLPKTNVWLGILFSRVYAKWCVQQMIKDARNYFANDIQ